MSLSLMFPVVLCVGVPILFGAIGFVICCFRPETEKTEH